jgi:hypothetical protein
MKRVNGRRGTGIKDDHTMRRIEVVMVAILLLPVIATGFVLLMGWPISDKLFYLNLGWVLGWSACYLGARAVFWIIARWITTSPKSN